MYVCMYVCMYVYIYIYIHRYKTSSGPASALCTKQAGTPAEKAYSLNWKELLGDRRSSLEIEGSSFEREGNPWKQKEAVERMRKSLETEGNPWR